MSHEAQIIILEHIPTDAELFELQLRKANIACSTKRVATKEQFLRLIQESQPDLVIADISMPKLDPLTAMELAKEVTPGVPWIHLSSRGGGTHQRMFSERCRGFHKQENVPSHRTGCPARARTEGGCRAGSRFCACSRRRGLSASRVIRPSDVIGLRQH